MQDSRQSRSRDEAGHALLRSGLSENAIEEYVFRYQGMVAAQQQDPEEFKWAYQGVKGLVLSIDGLQPVFDWAIWFQVIAAVWFVARLLGVANASCSNRRLCFLPPFRRGGRGGRLTEFFNGFVPM